MFLSQVAFAASGTESALLRFRYARLVLRAFQHRATIVNLTLLHLLVVCVSQAVSLCKVSCALCPICQLGC